MTVFVVDVILLRLVMHIFHDEVAIFMVVITLMTMMMMQTNKMNFKIVTRIYK